MSSNFGWFLWIFFVFMEIVQAGQSPPCPPLSLLYGRVFYQNPEKTATFSCNPGFQMTGRATIRCWEGSWDHPAPICFSVQPGCPVIRSVENGYIVVRSAQDNGVIAVNCNAGFERMGSPVIFCNGTKWNDSITPICKEKIRLGSGSSLKAVVLTKNGNSISTNSNSNASVSCSFQSSSCGWIQETSSLYKWTLQTGKLPDGNPDVGPAYDVTLGPTSKNGMYMFARPSGSGNANDSARLLSPVLNATSSGDWCLSFWYNIHGIRPRKISVFVTKFGNLNINGSSRELVELFGNNTDQWINTQISIRNETDSFRVVFEIKRGVPYAAEAALDEISIRNSVCETTSDSGATPISQESLRPATSTEAPINVNGSVRKINFNETSSAPDSDSDSASVENIENDVKEVNIDIYEVGNRSFVDEASEFTIEVIHPHSATINPTNFGNDYRNSNKNKSTRGKILDAVAFVPQIDDSSHVDSPVKVWLYVAISVGISLFVVVIFGSVGLVLWRRKRRLPQSVKSTTEETEFQYFSYNNEGFREVATMSADRKSVRKY